jgi:hypothetical protein
MCVCSLLLIVDSNSVMEYLGAEESVVQDVPASSANRKFLFFSIRPASASQHQGFSLLIDAAALIYLLLFFNFTCFSLPPMEFALIAKVTVADGRLPLLTDAGLGFGTSLFKRWSS